MWAVLAVLNGAFAADVEQSLRWEVTLDGTPIGERTMTVKWFTDDAGGMRRVLEVWTQLDARVIGVDYSLRQRITANAAHDAAAFHAVTDLSGEVTEVQGRRGLDEWLVDTSIGGKGWFKNHPLDAIDLSSADLLDPSTRFALSRFTDAKILFAESGDIVSGKVERLGKGAIEIDGVSVPVEGYQWTPDTGNARFWYSSEGYLVRYEVSVMTRRITGTLDAPPPAGTDDAPVRQSGSSGITEVPL